MAETPTFRIVDADATLAQLREEVAVLQKKVQYLTSGNLGSIHIMEVGGWTIGDDFIRSESGVVGLSSAETVGDDIRFWAGNATPALSPYRVYDSGKFVATNAEITGSITMTSGTISWGGVGAPNYTDITGTKPPTDADNTALQLIGNGFTLIGPTYIYTGTLTAGQINAVEGIMLGANATIDWEQVIAPSYDKVGGTKPPTNADNTDSALSASLGINYTKIGSTYVYTGTLSANQINAGSLDASYITGNQITIGETLQLSNTSFTGGLRWGPEDLMATQIYKDPSTGAVFIKNPVGNIRLQPGSGYHVYANDQQIDTPPTAVFG